MLWVMNSTGFNNIFLKNLYLTLNKKDQKIVQALTWPSAPGPLQGKAQACGRAFKQGSVFFIPKNPNFESF